MLPRVLVLAMMPACAAAPSTPSPAPPSPSPSSAAPAPQAAPPAASVAREPAAPLGPEEQAVLGAAEANPTVGALCADSARQGRPCLVYVDQPGEGACPSGLQLVHPCLWTLVVASNMGTHTSRRATLLVRPDGVLVAAANLFCPPMAPAAWEEVERASLAGTPVEDCPEPVGDAPEEAGSSRP